jgi:uracil phosphoribosyltransferase
MAKVTQIDHPLVHHHLAELRDRETPPRDFRALVERLTCLLVYEATRELGTKGVEVQTPLTVARCRVLSERIGVVPILRAGLGMVEPVLKVIPDAQVRHIGVQRDERTLKPVCYYEKPPAGEGFDIALVLDPMLATGGSAQWALQTVGQWGVKRSMVLSIIAAPEGIKRVSEAFPDTPIFVCVIDERLNEHGYIVPGLGDAGDRIFHT